MKRIVRRVRAGLFLVQWCFVFVITACGGGGGGAGGGNPSSSDVPSSTTQVIGSAGGTVRLADGTVVSFDSGLLKDGTIVTISVISQTPPEGMQPLSRSVVVDLPPGSLANNGNTSLGIKISLPNNAVASLASRAVFGRAALPPDAYRLIRTTIISNQSRVVLLGKPESTGNGLSAVVPVDPQACSESQTCSMNIAVVDVRGCFSASPRLFHVTQTNGRFSFDVDVVSTSKTPLVLIHGWQPGLDRCDRPYETVWTSFLNSLLADPELSAAVEVYSFTYDTTASIDLNGQNLANALSVAFGPTREVVILAHSMGGLVSRSALVNHEAKISGLVTLGTPHHGSHLASEEAPFPPNRILEIVVGSKLTGEVRGSDGVRDLAWDNFDGGSLHDITGALGNAFLQALNCRDVHRTKYVALAGVDDSFISFLMPDPNDGFVPLRSATFWPSCNRNSELKLQKSFNGVFHIDLHENATVLRHARIWLRAFLPISFTTPLPAAPITLPATEVSATSAKLNGRVNPNGTGTVVAFEWGTSVSYGRRTAVNDIGGDIAAIDVTANLSGLIPNTTYHFRVIASDDFGAAYGADRTFTTPRNWSAAQAIEPGVAGAGILDVALGSRSDAVVAWTQLGAPNRAKSKRYLPETGWQAAEYIDPATSFSDDARVTIDASGNMTAVWFTNDGLRASRYRAGSGWGPSQSAQGGSGNFGTSFDASGNAIAVWESFDGTVYRTYANRYAAGGTWGTPQQIEMSTAVGGPRISMNPTGDAMIVWQRPGGEIWARRYVRDSGWDAAERIGATANGAHEVLVDSRGNAVVSWFNYDGNFTTLWTNRYVLGAGWGSPQSIGRQARGGMGVRMVADPNDNVIVLWALVDGAVAVDGADTHIWSSRYIAGNGWQPAELVATGKWPSTVPEIGIDAAGNALVIWRERDRNSSVERIWSSGYSVGIGWASRQLIAVTNGIAVGPRIAVAPTGDAIAIWSLFDGISNSLWAARYE